VILNIFLCVNMVSTSTSKLLNKYNVLEAQMIQMSASLKNCMMSEVPNKNTVSVNFSCTVLSLLDFLTREDGTDRLSQNTYKDLPFYAAYYLRRVQISYDDLVRWSWFGSARSRLVFHMQIYNNLTCLRSKFK
jgi:hypothetical protein